MQYINGYPVLEDADPLYDIKKYTAQMAGSLYLNGGLIGAGDGQIWTQYPADSTGEFAQIKIERVGSRHGMLTGTFRAGSAIAAETIIKLKADLAPEVTPAQTHMEFVPVYDVPAKTMKLVRFAIFRTRLLQIYCPMALGAGAYGGVSIRYRLDK